MRLAAQWRHDAGGYSITVAGAAPALFESERTGFPCT
jgi:hypothetical protein